MPLSAVGNRGDTRGLVLPSFLQDLLCISSKFYENCFEAIFFKQGVAWLFSIS